MKILDKTPETITRFTFSRIGEKSLFLNLVETNKEDALAIFKKHIEELGLSPFQTGNKTNVLIRESIGIENKASKSISFRGLSAKEAFDSFSKNTSINIKQPEQLQTIIRLRIGRKIKRQENQETLYLALIETTVEEVEALIRKIVAEQNIDPFIASEQLVTRVYIHESIGWKAGKHVSASFKGLSPQQTMQLFKENMPTSKTNQ